MRRSKKQALPKRVLINFPTNIGDMLFALPALDLVCASYPERRFTAIASPATKKFLLRHSFIDEVVIYDKAMPLRQKMRFIFSQRGRYDMIVDFKHSFLPFLMDIKRGTPLLRKGLSRSRHCVEKYRDLVKPFCSVSEAAPSEFEVKEEEKTRWKEMRLGGCVCLALNSKSKMKTYPDDLLPELVKLLAANRKVVLFGDSSAAPYYKKVKDIPGVIDLSGKTELIDVYYILKEFAAVCVAVDSSIMHMASYIDIPVVALFGPTDEELYRPKTRCEILRQDNISCRPCMDTKCAYDNMCMRIDPERIFRSVEALDSYKNP